MAVCLDARVGTKVFPEFSWRALTVWLLLQTSCVGDSRVEKIESGIEMIRFLSENGKLKERRGIALVEEIFELLPQDECERVFHYLELRSSWLQKLGADLPNTVRGTQTGHSYPCSGGAV